MAVTDLTGTKWLLEQGWTAVSGFGLFSISGVIYDTNDSLGYNGIEIFHVGYNFGGFPPQDGPEPEPIPSSNRIFINYLPTHLTSTYYYEFEITGGTDVTNTTLINWLETNATQIIEPSTPSIADKLQDLLDIKQDIKEVIENKGADLTGVDFGGYAEKIDEIPAVVELTQAMYDGLSVYDNNTYYLIVEIEI